MTIGDEQVSSDEATNPGQRDLLLARLEGWMRDHIDGFRGPLAAEQFEGGQSNPTYKLLSGAGSYVLRRKPLGQLLPSAHAVDREYRVMRALAGTAVPVPKVFALCEDDAVIGRHGMTPITSAAHSEHLALLLAVEQVHQVLHADKAGPAVPLGDPQGAGELPGMIAADRGSRVRTRLAGGGRRIRTLGPP